MSARRLVLVTAIVATVAPPATKPETAGGEARSELVDVVTRSATQDPRFHRVADDVYVARVSRADAVALAARDPALAVLPGMRLATNLAIPIIGVPTVEAQGFTGKGTYVGIVDGGFDVRHPALRDVDGKTRFAWYLDYSRRVRGVHASLEEKVKVGACLVRRDDGAADDGGLCAPDDSCPSSAPCAIDTGAVYSGEDLDALLAALPNPPEPLPVDEEGHGTHALAIAAGSRLPSTPFRGVASEAKLVGVKSSSEGYTINAGAVVLGVGFIFDRAKEAGVPASVNLSLSADFVVRDGTDPLGPAFAALARGPGRVIVIAAGNLGDPLLGLHQTVSVAEDDTVRVRLKAGNSSTQVIVTPHGGADVRVGCSTPQGAWVLPVARGKTKSAVIGGNVASVIFNPADFGGRLPAASTSALVTMEGALERGPDQYYSIDLEGRGVADLWITGGAFEHGVREQTVGSPAMHPDLIAVGASVAREGFHTLGGEDLTLLAQVYDKGGLLPLPGVGEPPLPGHVAGFSGAGPGPTGVIKPDLVAPGVAILSAASTTITASSIFDGHCLNRADGTESTAPHCNFADADHAEATGTSFAAPFVTGAAAILLQNDPTLTQEEARIALQAGVHRHRSAPRFPESASPGELDVPGALEVARRLREPVKVLPTAEQSWITASSHYLPSDGTRPLEVLVHVRDAGGVPADGFDVNRFAVSMRTADGVVAPARLHRVGPGLWSASFDASRHGDGSAVRIEATFDGAPVAAPLSLPIALDPWQASYPSRARGGECAIVSTGASGVDRASLAIVGLAIIALVGRRAKRGAPC